MAMSDKMQAAAGGGGNEMVHQQHHAYRHQWFPVDERDGFISWLRGEFAAANAIIDSLCHHLRNVGEPGEYDVVIGSIQQRRCNWNPVLHMQQYFSIAEVILSLQQVASRRQQQQQQHHQLPRGRYYYDQPKVGGKEYRRSSSTGFNKGNRGDEVVKEVARSNVENHNADGNSVVVNVEVEKVVEEANSDIVVEKLDEKVSTHTEDKKEGDALSSHDDEEKPNLGITPRTFTGPELIEGNTVNVVEGLRLYDHFMIDTEVLNIISLVNDFRAAGRKGHCQGQTYVVSKKPMRGHGRETIQFGFPIIDVHMDDANSPVTFKERKVDLIPALLQGFIDRLVSMHLVPVKPDCCIIDIYYEGDYSQPYLWPSSYGKSVSTLFLTDCDMTFGRVILNEHPGDYKGSLKLALGPGSLLIMEGKSAEFARHALPAIRKQRTLVTFIKSQPKKFALGENGPRLAVAPPSYWGPPPSRSPNHIRYPIPSRSTNHYASISATGVLPAPSIRSQVPGPNGVQPLFVTAPVAAPMPFPAPVPIPPPSTGWAAAAPRHPASRLPAPAPGTGVFLPPSGPGSGNAAPPVHAPADANPLAEAHPEPARENGSVKSNHDGKAQLQDCNGAADGRTAPRECEKTDNH